MKNNITQVIPLEEPQRGKDLLLWRNEWCVSQERFVSLAPLLADGVVLTYPVILLFWYIQAMITNDTTKKIGAVYVFASAGAVAIINLVIQLFVDKSRPEGYIDNAELLIMDHLPTAPFPSDHAAVGFAVASAILLWTSKHEMPFLRGVGRCLLLGAVVMSMSRVGVGIHRPTDVIVGGLVGILTARWLLWNIEQGSRVKRLILRAISIEEKICKRIFG